MKNSSNVTSQNTDTDIIEEFWYFPGYGMVSEQRYQELKKQRLVNKLREV